MIPKRDVASALDVEILLSQEEVDDIELWKSLFLGEANWNTPQVPSLNLAYSICAEIARNCVSEFESEIQNNEMLNEWYQELINGLGAIVEQMGAVGSVLLRPYIAGDKIAVNAVGAGNYFPVRYDVSGELSEVVVVDRQQIGELFYTLLSHLDFVKEENAEYGEYTIINKAFRSSDKNMLGSEVALSEVEAWKYIEPTSNFQTTRAWFVELIAPNNEAVFHRAIELIRLADELDSLLVREFKNARSRIIIDKLMAEVDSSGRINDSGSDVFMGIDTGLGQELNPIIFNPEIRVDAYQKRKQELLRQIEISVGLSFGILSETSSVEKTATEIMHGRQRFFVLVNTIQKQLEKVLREAVVIYSEITHAYSLGNSNVNKDDVTFVIGDSIMTTEQEQLDALDRTVNALLRLQSKGEVPTGLAAAYMYEMSKDLHSINDEMIKKAVERVNMFGGTQQPQGNDTNLDFYEDMAIESELHFAGSQKQ